MTRYEGHPFRCVCGETHRYLSSEIDVLRELSGMRLVIACPKWGCRDLRESEGSHSLPGFRVTLRGSWYRGRLTATDLPGGAYEDANP